MKTNKNVSQIRTLKTNPEAVLNAIRCVEAIQEIVTRAGTPEHVISKETAKALAEAVVQFPEMTKEQLADFVTIKH